MEDDNFTQKEFYLFHNWVFYKGEIYRKENTDVGEG